MGLHLIPNNLNLNFVGIRKICYITSIIILLAGIASLAVKGGPSYGIDFAGGATVQITFDKPISDEAVKKALAGSDLPGLVVQGVGDTETAYMLNIASQESGADTIRKNVTATLEAALPDNHANIDGLQMVSPKIGADLWAKAVEALYYAMLLITIYVSGRFEQRWGAAAVMAGALAIAMYALSFTPLDRMAMVGIGAVLAFLLCWKLKLVFAIGAIISIFHDVIITIGLFSILDKKLDLTIIAALLTIVGYSLNDTIIVYDRIRENLRGNRKIPLTTIINNSINQTISRTVLTSGTTLFVIGSLLMFGGNIIHDFALVMFIGVIIGTYSSMFVASPVLLAFGDAVIKRAEAEEIRKANEEKNKGRTAQV